ncbi:type II-A CRISPR-associated protein Csn2 [Vagococcus vulneris]|uniref:Type II-A CRISPR-associated protein Csn2 n=1 Tax=Vagococcus vulneris TaxID=1977869 RepID=A0A430A0E3_9ENTE|nr:type II-A CRISPR-associated protein Csn2 [Vagococcus vulneris]RST99806.1 type II-A CRISPR-associated protein Csn2 [Vagococcus vulneris]
MMINFPVLDQPLCIENATYLVIENQKLFAHIIQQFYQYGDDSDIRLFNTDYKTINANKLLLVTDILGFDINSNSVIKMIYGDLEEQFNMNPELKTKIELLANQITNLIGLELLNHELDLEFDEITILELFKALGIKVETENHSLFEKIMEIVQIFKYLSKKSLLIFVNVCGYFSSDELQEINNYISLSNCDVLFLEHYKVPGVKQYIIDEDFFIIN